MSTSVPVTSVARCVRASIAVISPRTDWTPGDDEWESIAGSSGGNLGASYDDRIVYRESLAEVDRVVVAYSRVKDGYGWGLQLSMTMVSNRRCQEHTLVKTGSQLDPLELL